MQTLFTGDPSTTVQYFPRVSIKIHCCRYWWLKNWEYSTLSFPFWRIYHNTGVGGVIEYRGTTYRMETNKVYLIAPNTDYSSRIEGIAFPVGGIAYVEETSAPWRKVSGNSCWQMGPSGICSFISR